MAVEPTEKSSFWGNIFKWLLWLIVIAMFLLGIGIGYIIYINRYIPATPAQVQQTQNDLRTLAQALQKEKLDTGFYVTLEALADPPGIGRNTTSNYSPFHIQYNIQSEPVPFAIDSTGKLVSTIQFPYNKWKGPYINFQYQWGGVEYSSPHLILQGPADPWWTLYKFYTPQGVINPDPRDPKYSPFTTNTLVSYGADQEPGYNGSTVGTGDDFVFPFLIDTI